MPTFAADDPLASPQRLDAAPDAHFWGDGLGFGIGGVLGLGSDFDVAWQRAFGAGENKAAADEILARHGAGANVRRNLLLAAWYVDKTDVEAVGDVCRSLLGDAGFPDANARRLCRNGLAARILAKKPAALLGVRAIDDFSPRRHFGLALCGDRRPGPVALHSLDWSDVAARALTGLGKAKGSLLLRAIVVRRWRDDVFLAFREEGRSSPNWKPETPHVFQPGNKREWRWVRLLDGGRRAQIAGIEAERALEIASAVATAIWTRPCEYSWARDPMTPDQLAEFHRAVVRPKDDDPKNDHLKLVEMVAEQPGFYMRPTLKVGNSDQIRVEPVLHEYWEAGIGLARDPGHVLRVKLGFAWGKRTYRIEVHYPEDPLAEEPTLGFGTCGVHPDVADAFTAMVWDKFKVVVNPRSPADAWERTSVWRERPSNLRPSDWARMLSPALLRPAPWEKRELEPYARKGILRLTSHAVFRCGSAALLRRPHGAPDGCTGTVIGQFGAVSGDDPFSQVAGEPLTCDRCNAHWHTLHRDGQRRERLPWQERITVVIDAEAAWRHLVERLLVPKYPMADRSTPGVFGWYTGGSVFEVVSVALAPPCRLEKISAAGRQTAWFATSVSEGRVFDERAVYLADVLADGVEAFKPVHQLGPLPLPAPMYASAPPMPSFSTAVGGGDIAALPSVPQRGGDVAALPSVVLQRGDDGGAYLLDKCVVKASERVLLLVIAALQDCTDDEAADPRERAHLSAGTITTTILTNLDALGGPSLPARREITAQKVYDWTMRVRDNIDAARVASASGADVIEKGGKKGIRLGSRFRIEGFPIRDEARRYKESAAGSKRVRKR